MKIQLFRSYKRGLLKGFQILTINKRYSLIDISVTPYCSGIGIGINLFSFVNGETVFIRLNLIKQCVFIMMLIKHHPND